MFIDTGIPAGLYLTGGDIHGFLFLRGLIYPGCAGVHPAYSANPACSLNFNGVLKRFYWIGASKRSAGNRE